MIHSATNCLGRFALLVAVTMGAPLRTSAAEATDASATLTEIAAAWKGREASIHSGEFEWKEVRVVARSPEELKRGPFDPPAGSEPPGTITDRETYQDEYTRKLLFKGAKLRFFDSQPPAGPSGKKYTPNEWTYAFDGDVFTMLYKVDMPATFLNQATILPGTQMKIQHLIGLKPLLLHFQPVRFHKAVLSEFKLTGEEGLVGETACVILRQVKHQQGVAVVESLWLDPLQGFCVRRIATEVGDVVTTRFDISYDFDAKHGPIPKGWKLLEHCPSGRFDRSVEASVVLARVNHEVSDGRFTVDFPVDTLVRDSTCLQAEDPVRYFVLPHGKRRLILPEEWRAMRVWRNPKEKTGDH